MGYFLSSLSPDINFIMTKFFPELLYTQFHSGTLLSTGVINNMYPGFRNKFSCYCTSFIDNDGLDSRHKYELVIKIIKNNNEEDKRNPILNTYFSFLKIAITNYKAFANGQPMYTNIIKGAKDKPEIPKNIININRQDKRKRNS